MVKRDWFIVLYRSCGKTLIMTSYNDQVKEEEEETTYHCATIVMGYGLIG